MICFFVVYTGSSNVANKMRHGQLVSNSTQVTPNLLGLDYGPKYTKDVKTQTLMKDFPKEEAQIPELDVPFKKRRGRKPAIMAEVDVDMHAQETEAEIGAGDKGGEGSTQVRSGIKEDVEVTEMEEFCNAETEFIVNIIAPSEIETPAGVRRSGRTRKPTPKILDSSSRKIIQNSVSAKSPKKLELQSQTEVSEKKMSRGPTLVTSPSSGHPPPNQDTIAVKNHESPPNGEVMCEEKGETTVTDIQGVEIAITVDQPTSETKQEESEETGYMSLLHNPDAVAAVDELLQNVDGRHPHSFNDLFLGCTESQPSRLYPVVASALYRTFTSHKCFCHVKTGKYYIHVSEFLIFNR